MITTMASRSDPSGLRFYSATVMGLLGHPRTFFRDLPESPGMAQAAGFLTVCAIVHSIAALVYTAPANSLVMGGTLLANAIGMVFLLTGLGYAAARVSGKGKVRFGGWFRIYALSTGVTLLVSWVPALVVYTEIWKWWLIATGMTYGLGFRWYRALAIVGVSIVVTILLFHWLLASDIRL
ncbi:YIP1 family protein [Desulfosarcina sp.]|uniref:YIP1 family protein n=1 Tax=Desulfosarcina sp. TaxID=2027861 RepID=UPI00356268B6